jgi:hypothetical protein
MSSRAPLRRLRLRTPWLRRRPAPGRSAPGGRSLPLGRAPGAEPAPTRPSPVTPPASGRAPPSAPSVRTPPPVPRARAPGGSGRRCHRAPAGPTRPRRSAIGRRCWLPPPGRRRRRRHPGGSVDQPPDRRVAPGHLRHGATCPQRHRPPDLGLGDVGHFGQRGHLGHNRPGDGDHHPPPAQLDRRHRRHRRHREGRARPGLESHPRHCPAPERIRAGQCACARRFQLVSFLAAVSLAAVRLEQGDYFNFYFPAASPQTVSTSRRLTT